MKSVRWIVGIVIAIPCVLIAVGFSQLVVSLFADSFVKGFNEGGDGSLTTTTATLLNITSWIFLITYGVVAFLIIRRIANPKPPTIIYVSNTGEGSAVVTPAAPATGGAPAAGTTPVPATVSTPITGQQSSRGSVWIIGTLIAIPSVYIASLITSGIIRSITHLITTGLLDNANGPLTGGADLLFDFAQLLDGSAMAFSLIAYGLIAWVIVRRKAEAKPKKPTPPFIPPLH